jgi:hypothetical protein
MAERLAESEEYFVTKKIEPGHGMSVDCIYCGKYLGNYSLEASGPATKVVAKMSKFTEDLSNQCECGGGEAK